MTITIRSERADAPGLAGRQWRPDGPATARFGASHAFSGVEATGELYTLTEADTWYPSRFRDGSVLSPWTDGSVGPWGCGSLGMLAATGYAGIHGDDPRSLRIVPLGTRFGAASPYYGRYPSGGFVADGIWFTGTYCVNESGSGGNLDILGPFVGFDATADRGHTWLKGARTPASPLFGENPNDRPVRIGSPHAVDFGRELEHSPDGNAYFLAHGAVPGGGPGSWITGDGLYLLRVEPRWPQINEPDSWEYFAGRDASGAERWTRDQDQLAPLLSWPGHLGCVTATWVPARNRYLMFVTDGGNTVSIMNSMILEAPALSGPWHVVAELPSFGPQAYFLNAPSGYVSRDGSQFWLWYSANFTNGVLAEGLGKPRLEPDPAGSRYGLCMLELKLLSS